MGNIVRWFEHFPQHRSHNERAWDVLSVSSEAFLSFMEAWTLFLARGLGPACSERSRLMKELIWTLGTR
jgi:hypothetical protein